MQTECSASEMDFGRAGGRRVVADFDGGMVSSDAAALLLGEADKSIRLVERFAACFQDFRNPLYVVHPVATLVAQRVFGLALGYEDLIDHDELRRDPILGVLLGAFDRGSPAPEPLAGKSTLNRLEHAPAAGAPSRYPRSAMTASRSSGFSSMCSSTRTPGRRARSCSTSTPRTIRCTAIRKAGSFTAITTATAICRSIFSAGGICSPPNCGARTSTAPRARSRRWRGSSHKSARAGQG